MRAAKVAVDNGVNAMMSDLFDAWLIALKEALTMSRDETAMPVSDGHYTQRLRGERLLLEIEDRGTQAAAWAFAMEEIETPDLITLKNGSVARDAQRARFQRYKATVKGKAAVEAKAKERKEARAGKRPRFVEAAAQKAQEIEAAATSASGLIIHLSVQPGDVESFVAELRGMATTGAREIAVTLRWDDDAVVDGFDVWDLRPGLALSQDDIRRLSNDSRVNKLEVRR